MILNKFKFTRFAKRNDFTKTFGSVGRKRTLQDFKLKALHQYQRSFWNEQVRRAHQGWRNKRFGAISALKFRLKYGRRKPIGNFRR